jgi:Lysozyme like domain
MGELLGVKLQSRKIVGYAYDAGIQDARELVTCICVCLAESAGYDRAYNDNVDGFGKVISRDVGLWQINIAAHYIGTDVEEALYNHTNNAVAMYKLYANRGWQPWAAYNSNVYLHDHYLREGALAVQNFLAEILVNKAKKVNQFPLTRVPMLSLKELESHYK